MEIFRSITPEVEPLSLDEAFLDVSGAIRRLGSPRVIAALIRQRVLEEQNITCSVGVASNKFLAKLASTAIKPDGLLVVPPAKIMEFLHPLPVSALWGVGPKVEEQLHRLGLKTVAEIAHTPRETLIRAMGQSLGEHLHELSWGRDDRTVASAVREKSIGKEKTFLYDTDNHEEILRHLLELSENVARKLRSQQLHCTTVVLKLRFSDFTTISRSLTLPGSIDTGHEIYAAVKRLYEKLKLQRIRVRLVGVRAEGLIAAEDAWAQLELGQPELRWREAEKAMDKAHVRFGSGSVKPASLIQSDDNLD
jgi:DNA polymerase-4